MTKAFPYDRCCKVKQIVPTVAKAKGLSLDPSNNFCYGSLSITKSLSVSHQKMLRKTCPESHTKQNTTSTANQLLDRSSVYNTVPDSMQLLSERRVSPGRLGLSRLLFACDTDIRLPTQYPDMVKNMEYSDVRAPNQQRCLCSSLSRQWRRSWVRAFIKGHV